jgi:hypothetical protein
MKRPKGPELKMPELKAPAFLADLYLDLRDRRLLPLIALVVVTIAATPFLLGRSSETEQPPAAAGAIAAPRETSDRTSALTVVEATPGLRDYRKRLRGREPTDPFRQLGGSGASQGGGGSTATSSESSTSSTTTTTESSSVTSESTGTSPSPVPSGSATTPPAKEGGSGGSGAPRLIEFVFDVQISHSEKTADGGQKMSEPEVRRHVRTLDQLPGKKTPVVTVAGLNLHNGKVWFLVSDDVHSLDGDFTCVTRTPDGLCELLEIEPGFPLELVYGPGEDGAEKVVYRIKVTKIDAVRAGKVGDGSRSSRASFGGPAVTALPTR